MALELRKDSNWWYGRYNINGQRFCVNLGIEVRGKRPPSARRSGDTAFEVSRGLARQKLRQIVVEARGKKAAIQHLEQIYEIKAGEEVGSVALADMADHWAGAGAREDRDPKYVGVVRGLLRRFTEYIAAHHPRVTTMAQVTPAVARGFMDATSKEGITGRTYNAHLIMLRSVFKRLAQPAGLVANPLQGIEGRPLNTTHRKPFTLEQLDTVLKTAAPLIRPLLVTGMCTAMRKGDCCLLRWDDVNLAQGFIRVKTSKTGETAEIPIFPLLRKELEALPRSSAFVFPEIAALYERNPYAISELTKAAFEAAGAPVNQARARGLRSASVHDFHSLRTTWITIALTAGVPMELVRRVTGHQTVDVVLKHYFRPGREDFQKALSAAMPKLLTGGGEPGKDEPTAAQKAIDILKGMKAKTWRGDRDRAIELLETAK